MNVKELMFALVRSEICAAEIDTDALPDISSEVLDKLYVLSKRHDLAHIVANALAKRGFIGADAVSLKFQKEIMLAKNRYERANYELSQICELLSEAKVTYMPLKGSVIRALYATPWMRTSCDIDILVHEEQLDVAVTALCEKLGCTAGKKGPHDIPLNTPSGVHIELHYTLIEESVLPKADKILSRVWELSAPSGDDPNHFEMSDAMFYYYHIAHMAKHFVKGGCGVRPFIDLWIMHHSAVFYDESAKELLAQGGLGEFAKKVYILSEIWLSERARDELSEDMEKFILDGGVYGNLENKVAISQVQKGGKFKYFMSRIFMPYDTIKFLYPVLYKHKWLLPFMQVRRWFRIIRRGRLRHSVTELRENGNMTKEQSLKTLEFLTRVGL